MAEKILTLLEAAGIQEYIFGSNQLAQNIGASELVTLSTTKWIVDKLNEILDPDRHNVKWGDNGVIYKDTVPEDGWDAEVVYAGGGNSMILFTREETAKLFAEKLTLHLLQHARGLQLVVAHQDFKYEAQPLSEVHNELRGKVAKRKLNRPFSIPLLGLGVTASCVYTGLPAIGLDAEKDVVGESAAKKVKSFDDDYIPRLISRTVADKLHEEREGKERLHSILPQVRKHGYEFIYNFDELGSKDDSSYIAVIHADGNQIGKRFEKMAKDHPSSIDNDTYIATLRTFSETMQAKSKRALGATVDYLFSSLEMGDDREKFGGVVPIPTTKNGNRLLPFRPIVFGGDDVTFVCDGRLGLDLATKYLKEFTRPNSPEGDLYGGEVFARAGVAVVKTHYPFSRAYDLAEQLAQQAKNDIDDLKMIESDDVATVPNSATVIDWHFATTGMMFDITEVRNREYADGKLLMRPLLIEENGNTWRHWTNFTSIVTEFQKETGEWAGKRNKIKALRDALRGGKTAVSLFLTNYGLGDLPAISEAGDSVRREGWVNEDNSDRCAYFDAIEATDYFVSLKDKKKGEDE